MIKSKQENYYLNIEGDAFFNRNVDTENIPKLRKNKISILETISKLNKKYSNLFNCIEFGCNYGDLLNNIFKYKISKNCFGVEASKKAVDFGNKLYGENIKLFHGSIAKNNLIKNENHETFDLIIIDDVLSWVSRETIFQSIANVDFLLRPGGFIFIRDFYPNKHIKNHNHHAKKHTIYNFKVLGSHAMILLSSGGYQIETQNIFYDEIGMSTSYKADNPYIYRWTDIVLIKTKEKDFEESFKI